MKQTKPNLITARANMTIEERNKLFDDKNVVIIGGTGSFGHFIIRKILETPVHQVIVFSRDEEKQLDMDREFKTARLKFVIGDIRDCDRVINAVVGADIVYHAAALKIIPTCEKHPTEAISTNLLGTINVKHACAKENVPKAIFVSTDKAVKPVNTYGMTKALAEKTWLSNDSPCKTVFAAVRYGNVIGSRGSIVPYFKELIAQREPLPITSPQMSRFLITLEQAINLVFFATKYMSQGEIFVPNIPACKITDLATAMGGKNYPTKVVGIRPGEKIMEVLISEEEIRRTRVLRHFFIIEPHGRLKDSELAEEFTSENTRQLNIKEIQELIG
jgi:UDP-N-acetylglucosamine 4,6-dehydratase